MNSHDILAKHYFDITYLYRYELPLMGWSDAETVMLQTESDFCLLKFSW